jgi:hypothetical protein
MVGLSELSFSETAVFSLGQPWETFYPKNGIRALALVRLFNVGFFLVKKETFWSCGLSYGKRGHSSKRAPFVS